MKKCVFIFAIASAIFAGCSECTIIVPEPKVVPPPEPTKSNSTDRAKAFSIAIADSTEKASIDSIGRNIDRTE